MMKKIVYRSIGALLSMVMLCGCAAKENSGAVSDDTETFASSTVEESATEDVAEIAGDISEDLPYWKTIGLSEYESDYSPVNTEDEVKEYLGKREEKTLPLFVLFFLEEFTDESDMQMSKDCAYYLTKYVVEKYSYNDFLTNEYRNEWLAEIGATVDYRFDDIDETIEASTAEKKGSAVHVVCGGNKWIIRDVEWLKTADEVYSVLYETEDGIRKLCKRIAAESEIYDEESFRKDVTITATDKTKMSNAFYGTIELGDPVHFLHEYVHCTLSYSNEEMWIIDGVAEYYSMDYQNNYMDRHNRWGKGSQKWYEEGVIDEAAMAEIEQDGTLEYVMTAMEYYKRLREKDKDNNRQFYCYKYANGLSDLTYFGTEILDNSNGVIGLRNAYDTFYNTQVVDKLANNLTYEGAMVAVADLIAKYGVDSLISSSGSFEEDFGMTSDEYIQNYVDSKEYMHFLEE